MKLSTFLLFLFLTPVLMAQKSVSEGIFPVGKEGKFGFMNFAGDLVVPLEYDEIMEMRAGTASVKKGEQWGVINSRNELLVPWRTEKVQPYFTIFPNGTIGQYPYYYSIDSTSTTWLYNKEGYLVDTCSQCTYRPDVWSGRVRKKIEKRSSNDVAEIQMLDESGNLVFTINASHISLLTYKVDHHGPRKSLPFYETTEVINRGLRSKKILDFDGRVVMDSVSNINVSDLGYSQIKRNGIAGIYDYDFQAIIPFSERYQWISYLMKDSSYAVKRDDLWGLLNPQQELIIPIEHPSHFSPLGDHFYEVSAGPGKWYYLNKKGQMILDGSYRIKRAGTMDYTQPLRIEKDGRFGYLHPDGQVKIPAEYDFLSPFQEGLAIFKKGDKQGYINTSGEVVLELPYTVLSGFRDGFGAVGYPRKNVRRKYPCAQWVSSLKSDGQSDSYPMRFDYMDADGHLLTEEGFDWVYPFIGDYAIASRDCKEFFIDRKGKIAQISKKYKVASYPNNGYLVVTNAKEEHFGMIDSTGKLVLDLIYDQIRLRSDRSLAMKFYENGRHKSYSMFMGGWPDLLEGNRIIAKKDGKWGIVGLNGEIVLPFEYDDIKMKSEKLSPNSLPPAYFELTQSVDGETLFGLAKLDGTLLFPPQFNRLWQTRSSGNGTYRDDWFRYFIKDGKRSGMVNLEGARLGF